MDAAVQTTKGMCGDVTLLDEALGYIPEGKKSIDWDCVPVELCDALEERYGDLGAARFKVQARLRERKNIDRWPWNWPEQVDPQPFLEKYRDTVTPKDREWVERICANVRKNASLPTLSQADKRRITGYCPLRQAFKLMGIPYFKHPADKRRMERYWRESRQQGSARPG